MQAAREIGTLQRNNEKLKEELAELRYVGWMWGHYLVPTVRDWALSPSLPFAPFPSNPPNPTPSHQSTIKRAQPHHQQHRERLQRKAEQARQERERELEAERARAAAAALSELAEWKRKCGELERAYAEEKGLRCVLCGLVWCGFVDGRD